ncbi:MAG TPA: hypothetical protein EYG94_09400 [Campylobacterales bacterium]|nr:hypothetical protein [Campylobacterales bacterium]
MQLNINIEDTNLQEQISRYLLDKKQKTDEFLLEAITNLFQKEEQKPLMTKEEIAKTVENSQRIEGYEPASKEVRDRIKLLMKKHNVKVSF